MRAVMLESLEHRLFLDATVNQPPIVSIVNPVSGVMVEPGYYAVRADVFEPDAGQFVRRVDFFNGVQRIATVDTQPFSFLWGGVASGTYTLTAVATDNMGGVGLSQPVVVSIIPAPVGQTYWVDPLGNNLNPGTDVTTPLRTIREASLRAQPGDTVRILPGVYREQVDLNIAGRPDAPITFLADQGPGTVFVDGADPVTGFVAVAARPGVYAAPWTKDFFINVGKRHHFAFGPTGFAEQFFYGDVQLKHVLSNNDLVPGTFTVMWDTDRVLVHLPDSSDPSSPVSPGVFGSTRQRLFGPSYSNAVTPRQIGFITVKDMNFRHAANFAQRPAFTTSDGWRVENILVERTNGLGIRVSGAGSVLINNKAFYNGQTGISGSSTQNVVMVGNETAFNNAKFFPNGNEAGGGKWAKSNNVIFDRHYTHDNWGHGLWFDIENKNFLVDNSEASNNNVVPTEVKYWRGAGIHVELNDGPVRIEDSVFRNNIGPGVKISETWNTIVRRNLFVGGSQSIELRNDEDRSKELSTVRILNNRFKDWRLSAIVTTFGTWTFATGAQLKITINNNAYHALSTGPLIAWGDDGSLPLFSLQETRDNLNYEQRGRLATFAG